MPTNPILDELNGLSPGAQQALLSAHSASTIAPPAPAAGLQAPSQIPKPAQMGAPPPAPTATMSSPPPSLPASPMPNIAPPRGTLEGDINERGRMEATGPGISQIHSKIEDALPNHPTLGKVLGYGAEIPARILEAAGATLGPGRIAEQLLPGTQLHHAMELRNLNTNINNESQEQVRGAQAGEANARTGLTNLEAGALPQKNEDTHELTQSTIDKNERDKLPPPHFETLSDGSVIALHTDAQGTTTPEIVYKGDPKVKTEVKQLEIAGKPHQVLINSDTGTTIKDLGETGEKPPVINVHAGDARDFQEKERGRGLLDKAEAAYRTAQQGANPMRDMVASASAGNKMSAQVLPLEGALAITTAQGVHRINRTEVDQYAGAGNLYDRIAGQDWQVIGWTTYPAQHPRGYSEAHRHPGTGSLPDLQGRP